MLSGLNLPTAVRFAADGRILVAEQRGVIKLFDGVGDTSAEIVDDNRTAVHDPQGQNRGLLGFELDPEFPTRPYVYALYTRDAEIGGAAPLYGHGGRTSTTASTRRPGADRRELPGQRPLGAARAPPAAR